MVAGNRGMAPGRVLSRPTNCPGTSRRAPEEAQGPSQVSCARACRRSDHHPIRYAKRYRQVLCRRVEDLCLCGNEPVKELPYCETRASHMRFLNRMEKLEAKAIAHVNEAQLPSNSATGYCAQSDRDDATQRHPPSRSGHH